MRAQRPSRWRFVVLPVIILVIAAPRLLPRGTHIASWVLLLFAVVTLTMAVAVGVHAWRRAKIDNA